ncbi:hypothetical protein ACI68E_003345 [Malassezia pachydermatis]|uniref:DNA replication regulator Sld3 C-terminal domain-containing protein n=1 Tax=Malassezia pachydermatis TaxID=77020 RepID=A0A0M9VP84_9BASI|nr:hypothetical protein Malapachy_4164 [Malassezia pachydermatis]KOS13982.1 hypothetical protein Malapachy_4164 [Malassezia pachydermatis]
MTRVAVRTLRTAPTAAAGTGATAPLPDQPSVLARVERMYAYTLWMGEAHTPLQCFAKALVSLDGPLDAYLPLLQTPTQLREKYHGSYRDTIMSMLDHPTTESVPDVQGRAMHAAIQHGPFFTAAHSLDHRATAVRVFLSAIQCREVELQLILVAWMLTQTPSSSSSSAVPSSAVSTGRSSSKRKASRTHRWPGIPTPFAWGATAPRTSPPTKRQELAIAADYASLSALFEALADQLCLLQFSSTLAESATLYGSQSRWRSHHDQRDEAQWFCADVMEPVFQPQLSMFCTTLRTKCFGPGPATTPVRRRRMKRTVSAPSKPTRTTEPKLALGTMLSAEHADRRRSLSGQTRTPTEVHMSRRLVRTHSTTSVPTPSLTSTEPTPSATAPSSTLSHKRKRPASRWAGAPIQTLVMATPEHTRIVPNIPIIPEDVSPSSSPPMSPSLDRKPVAAQAVSEPSDSDVELIIPAAQKSARMQRDPWAYVRY